MNYIEHTSYGDIGTIGETLRIAPLELKGFTYNYATVNGSETELINGAVNGTIVREGLEIKLYYERDKYPYKIQYLDKDTLAVLKAPDVVIPGEYYGSVVTTTNPPAIDNYSLSSVSSCVITEDDGPNPTKNIINVRKNGIERMSFGFVNVNAERWLNIRQHGYYLVIRKAVDVFKLNYCKDQTNILTTQAFASLWMIQ